MALNKGQSLGPYEIIEPAGVGGMGEVYKARDKRLDRTVAVKVLPDIISGSADLRSRFDREAKAISSLNHPNICTLHDVGHQEGIDFLVMEYLEGETLAERLKKGPIQIDELFAISIQIADALDKAHKQGLVHRDLKPGNIMLTKSGAKLLDFGLAKFQMTQGPLSAVSGITQTTPLTGQGTILGTLQYMSPEQLEGKDCDGRSDIFSFGAILYEMATGKRAFEGTSQASLIASIIKEQPRPITQLMPLSPPMLDRVIKQCLEKDPDHRWQAAGDLKRALQWTAEGGSQVGIPVQVSRRRKTREMVLWGLCGVLVVATAGLAYLHFGRPTVRPKVARYSMVSPRGLAGITWPRISPDGTTIAFMAVDSTSQVGIYVRPINSLEPHFLVKVASDASRFFWSPDSKQLAFFENGQLKKVSVAGGLAQLICEADRGSDGSWGSSGIILFDGARTDSVRQVSASGGVPTAASKIDHTRHEKMAAWPCFLPDGEHFLYLADTDSSGEEYSLKVGSTKTLQSTILTRVNSRVDYANGYVLYVKSDLLVAQPFDPSKLKFTGEPIPLSSNVSSASERAMFSVSNDGLLIYQRGQSGGDRSLVWVNRRGDSSQTVGSPARYLDPALSPDGTRIAYGLIAEQQNNVDIWVRDLKRNVASRLTFGPSVNVWPVWSRDGSKVLFMSNRDKGHFGVFQRNANGTGSDEKVFGPDTIDVSVTSVSGDGSTYCLQVGLGQSDLWLFDSRTSKAEPYLTQPYSEFRGSLSPNGKYLVYQSDETSRQEIYIRELGPNGGKWQVSTATGRCPLWRADGRELYYLTSDFDFMAVPISYEKGLEIGTPVKLFNHRYLIFGGQTLFPYAPSPDGQRFLILSPAEQGGVSEFVIVENWPEELNK